MDGMIGQSPVIATGVIERWNNLPARFRYETRRVTLGELEAIYALHLGALKQVHPTIVKHEPREFFERLLSDDGVILGSYCGGELIAYGVLLTAVTPEEDPHQHFDLPGSATLAEMAGTAVHESYRGNGLHLHLIRERTEIARRMRLHGLFATASPLNPVSWKNLLRGGAVIEGLKSVHGGLRYLFIRRFGHEVTFGSQHLECLSEDLVLQGEYLSRGYQAYDYAESPDAIVFGLPTER